jgi:hypothetical protein
MKEKILSNSFQDPDFTRGLACGAGQNFLSLEEGLREKILEQIEHCHKSAQGFGLGLGHRFEYLPKDLQNQMFARAERNTA